MRDDSPAPFIVFRTPTPPANKATIAEVYEQALVLVGLVHRIIGSAATRFYLKDRLDRAATGLVFEIGRGRDVAPSLRWRNLRAAQTHAADCATVLDIFVHQEAAPTDDLRRARALVRELIDDLSRGTKA
jgi:hypothetical protein